VVAAARIQDQHRTGVDQAVHGERQQVRGEARLAVRRDELVGVLVADDRRAATISTATTIVGLVALEDLQRDLIAVYGESSAEVAEVASLLARIERYGAIAIPPVR